MYFSLIFTFECRARIERRIFWNIHTLLSRIHMKFFKLTANLVSRLKQNFIYAIYAW